MFTKLVRYQLRKINADRRPRVKGRFIKKEEQENMAAGAADASGGSASPDSLQAEGCAMSDDEDDSS